MKTTTHEQGKLAESTGAATFGQPQFEIVDLGPFENNGNDVHAINDRGRMAGVSLNRNTGRIEGFIEEAGERTPIGTLGGSFSIAQGINNDGEVVGGSLTTEDKAFHAFLFRENQLYDLNLLLEPGARWELIQALAINNRGEIVGIGSQGGEDRIVLLKPKS